MDDNDGQAQVPDANGAEPAQPPVAAAARPRRRRARAAAVVGASAALALGLFGGGMAWNAWSGTDVPIAAQGQDSTASRSTDDPPLGGFGQRQGGTTTIDPGQGWVPDGTTSGSTQLDSTAATAAQQVGLVTIVTTLGYNDAQAAGTGIVLTADGEILTNNHVIDGATEVEVTVESTGETYTATVVGTDATADVAVLQLADASGLATAAIDADGVAAGEAITAVGNAEGGGDLLAAAGTVTALDESITTQSEGASEGQDLTNLIEIDADVVSGDSGGAVLDAENEIVGMTTAASSGRADITGYAIPIADALAVAAQISAGVDTDTITIGYPAFLGVQLGSDAAFAAGATVADVFDGTPAAALGLTAGDTITALDGVVVDSGDALGALLAGYAPGDEVTVTWTTATGASQVATTTLIAGPAN